MFIASVKAAEVLRVRTFVEVANYYCGSSNNHGDRNSKTT